MPSKANPAPELTVVVPVFNEAANIGELVRRLAAALATCVASFEIVFVDDGSSDGTLAALCAARDADPRVDAISFSRNFGKEVAIAAGLDHARGRAVVIIDADLQHPPEVIPAMIAKWREGYENVYGQRTDRMGDAPLRRALTRRFYTLFEQFGETPLPPGAGDFRLLDRKAVNALLRMRERARFSKGLYAWIGFKSIGVPFAVAERANGASKFSYGKLTRFALDGLTSFSTLPLKVWTFIGMTISFFALTATAYFIARTMMSGVDVPGYASLIVSVMFFAGVQLLSLGVIGEYIGRIFAEVKGRPLYIVARHLSVDEQELRIDSQQGMGRAAE
ncbi:MAG: glycosyltransferase family 2 protein [Hyphomicrobiales bacterium]|nr:glycosyltransferase family 2 protein [Hyphomicrobiales bacterium]